MTGFKFIHGTLDNLFEWYSVSQKSQMAEPIQKKNVADPEFLKVPCLNRIPRSVVLFFTHAKSRCVTDYVFTTSTP